MDSSKSLSLEGCYKDSAKESLEVTEEFDLAVFDGLEDEK